MFLVTRNLYGERRWFTAAALTLTLALGLGLGLALGPAATRGQLGNAPPDVAVPETPVAALRPGQPAEVLRAIDGDTFEARVRVWPGIDITTKIRLRGIDAPEVSNSRCSQERTKAIAAREALRAILDEGDVRVSSVVLDKYDGRVLADVSTRTTPDVSTALLGAGHARSYSGGRREGWC
jgi:endonuclease YncB( thermonuclease family)